MISLAILLLLLYSIMSIIISY